MSMDNALVPESNRGIIIVRGGQCSWLTLAHEFTPRVYIKALV